MANVPRLIYLRRLALEKEAGPGSCEAEIQRRQAQAVSEQGGIRLLAEAAEGLSRPYAGEVLARPRVSPARDP